MKKYFAYDALEREFTTHNTLEEAKSQAQDYVDHTFDIGADNGFGDDLEDGIKETCFGVALGGFDLPTRSLTKEEEDIYGDQYTYMVENPVLVEYPQNNGWIKCSERLPNEDEYVLAWIESRYRPEYKSVTITHFYDGEFEIQAACHFNVLYWQPLPKPPIN